MIYFNLLIRSLTDKHLGCFQFGALSNKVAMDVHVSAFVWIDTFISLGKH